MRHKLSATDAKNRFAHALRQAEGGDVVSITRFGKPTAALVGAERLARLEAAAAEAAAAAGSDEAAPEEPTPEELLERAAAASLRRIDYDLARLPEKLRPVLRLIRKNLFRPRLTVERIKRVMKVGSHDLTTQFRKRAGASIRRYFEARRLEAAGRLLADTALEIGAVGRLVGYSRPEGFSRAFQRWSGLRPRVYREFGGALSPAVAGDAAGDHPALAPRWLAGVTAVAPGTACERCGGGLVAEKRLRVFDALAPICDGCARREAPELGALLRA